ncbi:hypothetical protein GCK72_009054 [Caenorhabditis remanei]|uniref:Uncharacterized protein n=1 Tax=Caenorhabditis remanei TaxID=31234 RepID=A0A6A5H1Z6_CAERE|nr:hypothetical protein GCK72_009054 [Caenorhabditis remanei]KAF1760804.1 hypothetical protein GCK72_009054 [Caenorhabditis remanei]
MQITLFFPESARVETGSDTGNETKVIIERLPLSKDDPNQEKYDIEFIQGLSTKYHLPVPLHLHRNFTNGYFHLKFVSAEDATNFRIKFRKIVVTDPILKEMRPQMIIRCTFQQST